MSDDPRYTYTRKWIDHREFLMCDECGAIVDGQMQSDHTALHEGVDSSVSAIMWVHKKMAEEQIARHAEGKDAPDFRVNDKVLWNFFREQYEATVVGDVTQRSDGEWVTRIEYWDKDSETLRSPIVFTKGLYLVERPDPESRTIQAAAPKADTDVCYFQQGDKVVWTDPDTGKRIDAKVAAEPYPGVADIWVVDIVYSVADGVLRGNFRRNVFMKDLELAERAEPTQKPSATERVLHLNGADVWGDNLGDFAQWVVAEGARDSDTEETVLEMVRRYTHTRMGKPHPEEVRTV